MCGLTQSLPYFHGFNGLFLFLFVTQCVLLSIFLALHLAEQGAVKLKEELFEIKQFFARKSLKNGQRKRAIVVEIDANVYKFFSRCFCKLQIFKRLLVEFSLNLSSSPPSVIMFSTNIIRVTSRNSTSKIGPLCRCSSSTATSRSWSVTRYHADLKHSLQLINRPTVPTIYRPSEVLVRVHAASINPLDLSMSRGYGQVLLSLMNVVSSTGIDRITYDRLPLTLGRDFVGEVLTTGQTVTNFKPGQMVWGTVSPFADGGSHADHIVVDESSIWRAPVGVSSVNAASLPYVGLTAWSALVNFGQLTPQTVATKRCLVLGGGGGVGAAAAQLLKHWNAHVVVTCSARSAQWLQSLVAVDEVVDYRQLAEYLQECHQESFDLILDASPPEASSANLQLISSWRQKQLSSRQQPLQKSLPVYLTLTSPLLRNLDSKGIFGGSVATAFQALTDTASGLLDRTSVRWAYYMPNQKALKCLTELVEAGDIKPQTGLVLPFDQALDAYTVADQQVKSVDGKVVLKML